MMRLSPGSSTPWNRPRRSTTQALCCGTILTPSITNATITPMTRTQGQNRDNSGTMATTTAKPIAIASFQNMVEPPPLVKNLCPSGGAILDDFERVAIGREHVYRHPGLERFQALDSGIPARAAVAHPREPRAGIDPGLEARRHAGVDRGHLLGPVLLAIGMYAIAAARGDERREHHLQRKVVAEPCGAGGAKCGDAEHHQVERPRQQLYDHQREPDDRPDERWIHASNYRIRPCLQRKATPRRERCTFGACVKDGGRSAARSASPTAASGRDTASTSQSGARCMTAP